MYRVPALIGAVLDRQPTPPRRVSGLQVLAAVAFGLDGGSYILGAAVFLGLAAWVAISASSTMAVVLMACGAIGLGCVILVAYRGVRLLSPKTIDLIFAEQENGEDLVRRKPLRFGSDYGLPLRQTLPCIPDGRFCFWVAGADR